MAAKKRASAKPAKKMAKKRAKKPSNTRGFLMQSVTVSEAEAQRFRDAGFAPVLRWVDTRSYASRVFKCADVRTILTQREQRAMKVRKVIDESERGG